MATHFSIPAWRVPMDRGAWRATVHGVPNGRASLVAQMVKNPPARQESWVRSLGWKDPLEEGMATHCSILRNT